MGGGAAFLEVAHRTSASKSVAAGCKPGVCMPASCGCTPATKMPFPSAPHMYDSQWPAKVPSSTSGNPMVTRPAESGEVPYCLLRPGWTYAPNRLTTKRWYKRLDTVQQGCMGNPGLCVEKGIKECEGTPSCSAISWWKGAMGRKAGDAGSIFLVKGITMANIDTTSRRHKHAMTMVKNS